MPVRMVGDPDPSLPAARSPPPKPVQPRREPSRAQASVRILGSPGRRRPHRRAGEQHRRLGAAGPASVRAAGRPRVRLSRISCLRSAVHFLSPMPAPARWTTASTPSRPAASMVPASGSQRTSSPPSGAPRTGGRRDGRRPAGGNERGADQSMGSGHEHVHEATVRVEAPRTVR